MSRIDDAVLGSPVAVERSGVRLDVVGHRLTLVAERDLRGLGTGRFSRPTAGVIWQAIGWPADVEFTGFAFTQFALPVTAGRDLDFDFAPAPGLRSPRAMLPLLVRSGDGVTLLAPIERPHEQIVAVADDGLHWGWHGDLDVVPGGCSATLGVYSGATVTEVLGMWSSDLVVATREHAGPVATHLSYWTDNGAAYWYRTEHGMTIAESVAAAVDDLRARDVPVRSVELDSWFYEHERPRPITEIGYPEDVPPTGATTWSARADAFPPTDDDPIAVLRRRLDVPLVLHARHLAPTSPYVDSADGWWIDESAAHPHDPTFFRRWFDDAVRWGASCIEQDWMLMSWFGVRGLRAAPDRAAAWQRTLNDHARATGVDLIWCMATPADMVLAATLDRVVAVRTSDDYRFTTDPALLWTWFLTVNRLADALGLTVFKDCFFSSADVEPGADAIDGDPHAELEALLAALSGGPVGIGDRIGRTDREVVMRTCDDDGRLRRVDRALAAVDDCLFGAPGNGSGLMWATTTSTLADGSVWTSVVAINTSSERRVITDVHRLGDERVVYDWRRGSSTVGDAIEVELAPRDWSLHVVAPPGGGDVHTVGDPSKYVVVESQM